MDIYLNNERYSQADVSIGMLGRTVVGVTALDYTEEQEVQDEYVVGNRQPAGYVRGNAKYSGSLTMFQDELFGLIRAAGGNWKTIPPFDITVTYQKGALVIKETLKGCIFKSAPRSMSAGGNNALTVQMNLRIGDIVSNA